MIRERLVLCHSAYMRSQPESRAARERDYRAMRHMILGEAPRFGWIVERFRYAGAEANRI